MKQTVTVFGFTLLFLALLDSAVALTLGWADRSNRLGGLVQYFEYGRSVPGKLEHWEANPNIPGNLYDVAWRSEAISDSAEKFQAEATSPRITVRSYGMSFVNNILSQVADIDPDLAIDRHSGPAAPPNFTFATFEDDRDNRNSGDVVVLGILSSSIPAMAALSNQTWLFEQPAPFTYPIYRPEGDGLKRIDPMINSAADHRDLAENRTSRDLWLSQLRQEDQFFGPQTFGASWLDASPFARLARRALVTSHISKTEQDVLNGAYPHKAVLQRMVRSFSETARADGQIPIVFLIQGRDARDVDLLATTQQTLTENSVPYLTTVEHFNPSDLSGFIADGHYTKDVDRLFAQAFLGLVSELTQ